MRTIDTKHKMMNRLSKATGISVRRMELLPKIRYDLGKYDVNGKGSPAETDTPIWYENRSDKHGKHIVIFCFNNWRVHESDKATIKTLKDAWNEAQS